MNSGYRIFKPRFKISDSKLAYAMECIRIWSDDARIERDTGHNPNSYIPTEKEFMEMRRVFKYGNKADQA